MHEPLFSYICRSVCIYSSPVPVIGGRYVQYIRGVIGVALASSIGVGVNFHKAIFCGSGSRGAQVYNRHLKSYSKLTGSLVAVSQPRLSTGQTFASA